MEQTREAVLHTQTGGKRLMKTNKTLPVFLLVTAGLLAAAYIGLCAYANAQDTFYPNRRINGVPVGGLTAAEAQTRLEETLAARTVTLMDSQNGQTLTSFPLFDLGYTAESFAGDAQFWMDTSQKDTVFLQKGWDFFATITGLWPGGWHWPDMDNAVFHDTAVRLSAEISQSPIDGAYTLEGDAIHITRAKDGCVVDASDFAHLRDISSYQDTLQLSVELESLPAQPLTAQEISDQLSGESCNAGYDTQTNSITPEKIGATFDVAAAQTAIDAAQPGETVTVEADIQYPTVTAELLESVLFRDLLGECTTHVGGTAARKANVRLSASTINGYVMNAGDVFSYNDALGQRTAANGYQAAPAYVKGETVDEIGGGICQTSSTLYLACLRSNLEITERYAHRYVPAYIPWGMDATVSWGGPDYKFTNNTPYPIRIVTGYKDNYLTVQILGTNETGVTARMTNKVLSTTPFQVVYEEDKTLAPGTETVKTTPYTGYTVKTYRHLYDADGKWISSNFEADSKYKVRNKVILRGPAPQVPTPQIPVFSPEPLPDASTETPPEELPVPEPEVPVEPSPEIPEEPDIPEMPEHL